MLIEFNNNLPTISSEFVNLIDNSIDYTNNKIITCGIPIIYNDDHFILTNLGNIQYFLIDKLINYSVTFYYSFGIVDNKILSNILSVHDESFQQLNNNNVDAYYDIHTNILLIKHKSIYIEYINITYNSKYSLLNFDYQNLINITWINSDMNIIDVVSNIDEKYYWEDKFLNLSPVPYHVSYNTDIIPTGAKVYTSNNKFCGMVSFELDGGIYITPLLSIIRSLEYIYGKSMSIFNIDTELVHFNTKRNINQYALLITSKYYDNLIVDLKSKIKNKTNIINNHDIKKKLKQSKYLTVGTIINSIDSYIINSYGNLSLNNIPIKSYIWLFKNISDIINIKIFSKKSVTLPKIHDNIEIYDFDIAKRINYITSEYCIFNNNPPSLINVSTFNYIKFNNIYLIELNENILLIMKNLLINNSIYDYLCDYLFDNKYSLNNKIILKISFVKNILPKIKIVHEYNNLQHLNCIINSEAKLKRFLS